MPEPPPPPPEVVLVAPTEPRYAASQILVAWAGAVGAVPTVTRTEAEARTLAEEIHRRAQAGEDFAALARERSDSPSGRRGGSIGVYLTGTMVPEFESAVAAVPTSSIAPLTRTPFGWHVIRRDAIEEVSASHLLVAWMDANRSASFRTQDEARVRAEEALGRIEQGEPFAVVARELSDDPSAMLGGDIGVVARGQMVPAFEDAVFGLEVGAHSGVVETPYGYHVILRTK
jgi:parvulin-like peptidyl-prolyl isomerase